MEEVGVGHAVRLPTLTEVRCLAGKLGEGLASTRQGDGARSGQASPLNGECRSPSWSRTRFASLAFTTTLDPVYLSWSAQHPSHRKPVKARAF